MSLLSLPLTRVLVILLITQCFTSAFYQPLASVGIILSIIIYVHWFVCCWFQANIFMENAVLPEISINKFIDGHFLKTHSIDNLTKIIWTKNLVVISADRHKYFYDRIDLHSVGLLPLLLSIRRGLSWYIDPLDLIRISGKREKRKKHMGLLGQGMPSMQHINNRQFHANFVQKNYRM